MLLPISRLSLPFPQALEEVMVEGLMVFFSCPADGRGGDYHHKLVSSWMQFGILFAPDSLKLDFNRLNPLSQLKQMFSVQSVMNLLMSTSRQHCWA